jgi:hypothetical protein
MRMSYKSGWDDAKDRWEAFWQGEIIDRPVMLLTVPVPGAAPLPVPDDYEYHWTDTAHQIAWHEARNRSAVYLAEAIPAVGGGPLSAWCAYYGGKTTFLRDTIWHEPVDFTWDDPPDWKHAWNDEGYRKLLDLIDSLCRARKGSFYVGFPPTLHAAPSDVLSAMRGVDRFLIDLVEYPEEVEAALESMSANFATIYDEIYRIIHSHGYEGYGNWWPVWSPDRFGVFQSDVSCMISGPMFERFVVPHLENTSAHVVNGVYHLDGPDAIRHVERVCELPNIKAIQWVPGSGTEPGALQWLDLFKRIQAKGRAVYLGLLPGELETIIRELDPRKLILGLGARTEEEAEEFMQAAARWTAKYWGTR